MDIILTLVALGFPLAVVAAMWRSVNPFYFLATICFALFMSIVGMGRVLPLGGGAVGGTTYFPLAAVLFAMAAYKFGGRAARRILSAVLLCIGLVVVGSLCWVIFSDFSLYDAGHQYLQTFNMLTNSLVMLLTFYFTCTVVLLTQKLQLRPAWVRYGLPVLIISVLSAPFAVMAVVSANPDMIPYVKELIAWAAFYRALLPLVLIEALRGSKVVPPLVSPYKKRRGILQLTENPADRSISSGTLKVTTG